MSDEGQRRTTDGTRGETGSKGWSERVKLAENVCIDSYRDTHAGRSHGI